MALNGTQWLGLLKTDTIYIYKIKTAKKYILILFVRKIDIDGKNRYRQNKKYLHSFMK